MEKMVLSTTSHFHPTKNQDKSLFDIQKEVESLRLNLPVLSWIFLGLPKGPVHKTLAPLAAFSQGLCLAEDHILK